MAADMEGISYAIIVLAIFFGPSALGVVTVLVASLRCSRKRNKNLFTSLALVLHSISSVLLFFSVRVGEAWSGYSSSHNMPFVYGFIGAALICAIRYFVSSAHNDALDGQNEV